MFPEGFKLWALYTRLSGYIYCSALLGYAVILAKGAGKVTAEASHRKNFRTRVKTVEGLFSIGSRLLRRFVHSFGHKALR